MTIGIDILTGEKINFSHDRHYKGKSIVSFPDDYCVIDIETTGLSPDWDSIIEIAAEKFHKGNLVDTFSSFVKPDDFEDAEPFLDDFIVDLTGITDEMLSTADSTASVLSRFYSFIGDSILIGHKDGKSSKQKKAEKLKLDGYDIEIIPENVFYDIISEN